MAFAGHCGVTLNLDALAFDAAEDVDAFKRDAEEQLAGRAKDRALAALFNEELGAVLQIRATDRSRVMQVLRDAGLGDCSHVIGHTNPRDELRFTRNNRAVLESKRDHLQRPWAEVTRRMQALRDHPACAREEYDRIIEHGDPGLSFALTYDPSEVFIATGARPRIAVLREQGVNGHVEMAAAFDRAGFEAVDVHMTELIAGRVSLEGFKGFAAGGGFSYGDVLGAGQGWAKSILFNGRARGEFERFFARSDTFALGACNGCQMMAALKELIPGARDWPIFLRNRSEQFEARFVMVEITRRAFALLPGHGRQPHADRDRTRRGPRFVRRRARPQRSSPCATSTIGASPPTLIHTTRAAPPPASPASPPPTAASPSSCRIPSASSAPCRCPGHPTLRRGLALDAHVPQRAPLDGMNPRQLVQAWVDAFNRADADALAAFYSEDATNHQVAEAPVSGRAAIRQMFATEFARANMVCIVENIFQDGDWAILEWRDPLGLRGSGFFHVVEGRIRFQRGYWDKLSLLRTHGLPVPKDP